MVNLLKRIYSCIYSKYKKLLLFKKYSFILDELKRNTENKRIILIGTSIYGNIGDQAISIAEVEFLKQNFSDYLLIEIPVSFYYYYYKSINRLINVDDIICLNGGGFLGTLWPEGQNTALRVIENCKNNIIFFPQTVYYEPSKSHLIEKHKEIYKKHRNVTMFVRDKKSYSFFLEHQFEFKNIFLIPDIVTYLNFNHLKQKSKTKLTTIMREDKEKISNELDVDNLLRAIKSTNNNYNIFHTDSVINKNIHFNNRDKELIKFLETICDSDLIITDRLHGLILSAIMGIPVISIDNLSKKVYGTYQWFQNSKYVFYYEDSLSIEKVLDVISNRDNYCYDNNVFRKYHILLIDTIKGELNESE